MRKLASIQKVLNVTPIDGYDRVELITVLGWQVVCQKDSYKVGDLIIYVEIDSILPEKPEFEFLRKNKFRIKTQKMCKTISQGICFPLTLLPNGVKFKEEDDVTNVLGVKKYEEDENNIDESTTNNKSKSLQRFWVIRKLFPTKKEKRGFPSYISKTDETRVQQMPNVLFDKTKHYVITEKLEGSSATYSVRKTKSFLGLGKDKFDYDICSRNIRFGNRKNNSERNSFEIVSDTYNIENAIKSMMNYFRNCNAITIQGELISPKIQGNIYNVKKEDLYVFNIIVYYKDEPVYLDYWTQKRALEIANSGLKLVPLIADNYVLPDTVEELLNFANGESKLCPTLREGLVFRCDNISFKAVSNNYLLKRGY